MGDPKNQYRRFIPRGYESLMTTGARYEEARNGIDPSFLLEQTSTKALEGHTERQSKVQPVSASYPGMVNIIDFNKRLFVTVSPVVLTTSIALVHLSRCT